MLWQYLLKRIAIFVPTLIVISLFTFVLSLNAPGDPVAQMLGQVVGAEGQVADRRATEQAYREMRKKLGLDLPVFYFSITSLAFPDTLYRIDRPLHRRALKNLIRQFGNWTAIEQYYHAVRRLLDFSVGAQTQVSSQALSSVVVIANDLLTTWDTASISHLLQELERVLEPVGRELTYVEGILSLPEVEHVEDVRALRQKVVVYRELKALSDSVFSAWNEVVSNPQRWKLYIPVIHWYGFNNQYHRWITGMLKGDFGISYKDRRPVSELIASAVRWTLLINLIAVIIMYLLAIPAGVFSAINRGRVSDRVLSVVLYILYSLPNFWVATLLIIFLGGGMYLSLFPTFGVSSLPEEAPLLDRILDVAHHLVLPVVCLTYPSLAFLSRQMRGSMLQVINQDYIRTAFAKGLPSGKVYWKHAFRNSLLPIITLFANVFPFLVSGSFVIEYIFSIPGMGMVTYEAILARDYPVVYAVVMLVSVMTLVGYLVADILYAIVDPRITYGRR